MNTLPDTWKSVVEAERGHVFLDRHDDGVRVLVMRGPGSLCAYVGVPLSHPLAGKDYDDVPLSCHGWLTFSREGVGPWPEGWWWYGWDYNHAGDRATYHDALGFSVEGETAWTPAMVENDMWSAVSDFKRLARLVERIKGGR